MAKSTHGGESLEGIRRVVGEFMQDNPNLDVDSMIEETKQGQILILNTDKMTASASKKYYIIRVVELLNAITAKCAEHKGKEIRISLRLLQDSEVLNHFEHILQCARKRSPTQTKDARSLSVKKSVSSMFKQGDEKIEEERQRKEGPRKSR